MSDLVQALNVSDMTIRRDLEELADSNKLIRIHGGAQSLDIVNQKNELSYIQKRQLFVNEKNQIAQIVASIIQDNDIVYLGPGTTNEKIAQYLTQNNLRIVTNSLPVFESIKNNPQKIGLTLIGGSYREQSGAFIGSLANEMLERLTYSKAFISVNGISLHGITNANAEEGQTQKIALRHAKEKFVVANHQKFDFDDFYNFYSLADLTAVITDPAIDSEIAKKYSHYLKLVTAKTLRKRHPESPEKEQINK